MREKIKEKSNKRSTHKIRWEKLLKIDTKSTSNIVNARKVRLHDNLTSNAATSLSTSFIQVSTLDSISQAHSSGFNF